MPTHLTLRRIILILFIILTLLVVFKVNKGKAEEPQSTLDSQVKFSTEKNSALSSQSAPTIAQTQEQVLIPESNILSAEQNAEIKNLDELYRKYKVIKAKFLQTDSLGNSVKGWFVIQKPGKARIEYEDLPIRIIANGKSLLVQDLKLKQKSFLPMSSNPFSYLLDENASLINDNIIIKDFKTYEEYHEITLVNKATPGLGYLVLYLTIDKAEIIKWTVYDAKGTVTDVYLLDPQFLENNIVNQNIFNVQNTKNIAYEDIK